MCLPLYKIEIYFSPANKNSLDIVTTRSEFCKGRKRRRRDVEAGARAAEAQSWGRVGECVRLAGI